jgi:hypothetical protein
VKFYDVASYSVLDDWLSQNSGEIVSKRQVAIVTSDLTYVSRLYRQHVVKSVGQLIIENALTHPGTPAFKIYWNL